MAVKRKYFGTKKKKDLSEFENDSLKNYKSRFSSWHLKQIDALTFSINLLFTISIAVSGFLIANQDKGLFNNKLICVNYSLIRTALFILTLSASIGIIGLITRLNDLRLTKDKIRVRQRIFELENDIKYEDYQPSDIVSLKTKRDNLISWTTRLGQATWVLFYIQLGLFILTLWTIVLNV